VAAVCSGIVLRDVMDLQRAGGTGPRIVPAPVARMAEAGSVDSVLEPLQAAFARIEAAVDAGDTDLARLGFWRLVREVKLDPTLAHHWADQVGRIDRKAFEARVRPRFPVWLGNLVLLGATLFGAAAAAVALAARDPTVAGMALVVGGGIWAVSTHDLAHYVVGRGVGIRFTSYFVGGPFPPRPGLKTDYATYLRASPSSRAWMHGSGALMSKAAPFVALLFFPASSASAWAAWTLLGIGALTIATDIAFSRTSSDWKKVIRERRIARAVAARLA
jgi:hypothetical protein